jgi:hypothetical protein
LTFPLNAANDFQDLQDMPIWTMPLADLAAKVGVTAASLIDGTSVLLVHFGVSAIPRYTAVMAALVDRTAASQAGMYGLGVMVQRSSLSEEIVAAWVHHSSSGAHNGDALLTAGAYGIGRLQHVTMAGANWLESLTEVCGEDDNGTIKTAGSVRGTQANGALLPISHFAIGALFRTSSGGTAGDLTATIKVAAVPAATAYYQQ